MVFLLAAIVSALPISLVFGLDTVFESGIIFLVAIAVAIAFPVGAVLGYPILYSEESLALRWIIVRGICVPLLTSSIMMWEMYAVMFASLLYSQPESIESEPYMLLMPIYGLFSGPILAQIVTGWITYPCGFAAAYILYRLRLKTGIPESRSIVLLGKSRNRLVTEDHTG
jgi:hypothetical protein